MRAQMQCGSGGPGTCLVITALMKLASEQDILAHQNESLASGKHQRPGGEVVLEPCGLLRVLIVDDQRTMRQMVSMLFQKLCQDYPATKVEIATALSGEEACRLVAQGNSFHLITMDETMSSGYCRSVRETQATERRREADAALHSGASVEDLGMGPPPCVVKLLLDGDRLATTKRRTDFFKDEISNHEVLDGDGTMDGHVAMKLILNGYAEAKRSDAPIVFNLTGNVMELERERYFQNGSSGVLPKPTKLTDLTDMLLSELQTFVARGTVVADAEGFFATPDRNFCVARLKRNNSSATCGANTSNTAGTPQRSQSQPPASSAAAAASEAGGGSTGDLAPSFQVQDPVFVPSLVPGPPLTATTPRAAAALGELLAPRTTGLGGAGLGAARAGERLLSNTSFGGHESPGSSLSGSFDMPRF